MYKLDDLETNFLIHILRDLNFYAQSCSHFFCSSLMNCGDLYFIIFITNELAALNFGISKVFELFLLNFLACVRITYIELMLIVGNNSFYSYCNNYPN